VPGTQQIDSLTWKDVRFRIMHGTEEDVRRRGFEAWLLQEPVARTLWAAGWNVETEHYMRGVGRCDVFAIDPETGFVKIVECKLCIRDGLREIEQIERYGRGHGGPHELVIAIPENGMRSNTWDLDWTFRDRGIQVWREKVWAPETPEQRTWARKHPRIVHSPCELWKRDVAILEAHW